MENWISRGAPPPGLLKKGKENILKNEAFARRWGNVEFLLRFVHLVVVGRKADGAAAQPRVLLHLALEALQEAQYQYNHHHCCLVFLINESRSVLLEHNIYPRGL